METTKKIPDNVIMVRKPGKRYFYVSLNRTGAEKWMCNGILSYVDSTDGEEIQVPSKAEHVPCGCDQPDDCSWEGCHGYIRQVIEAQEYDERFFAMLKSLFRNMNHKDILGNGLYQEVLWYIQNAKDKRKEQKIQLPEREVFWYSKKDSNESQQPAHLIASSTITKNLHGIESREYTSYCGERIFSWYFKGGPELSFGKLGEANSRGIPSCNKCLENLARGN